jgi:prepilin-type N-terminal cleavage/methylation domain-containing protein
MRSQCTAGYLSNSIRVDCARRGFTVIELLIVIAIIAVVCALILPAVQQVREGARQVQCRNNLHQIGLALQSYHAVTRCFPPGWIVETPIAGDSENGWGWLSMLLPEADQRSVYNSINFDNHLQTAGNETARLRVIGTFVCPSDHVPARVPFFLKGTEESSLERQVSPSSLGARGSEKVMFEVAGASYIGVFGRRDPDDRTDTIGDGVFSLNSRARLADMVDGASHTLVAGERSARRLACTWTGMHPLEEEGPERVVGFTDHTPNDPGADEAEFSSRHPNGAFFVFGDGSVRFLRNEIDRDVYQALGTRCGQEVIEHIGF